MEHFIRNIPGLGHVAVSRHAQAKMQADGISEHDFRWVLFNGTQVPDGIDVLQKRGRGIRIVLLLNPTPNRGAKLVKTVYREKPQARVRF